MNDSLVWIDCERTGLNLEADALIESLGWPRERVLFMPEATDRETLRARGPLISAAALRRGVRYTSRLHIELFGGRRGT